MASIISHVFYLDNCTPVKLQAKCCDITTVILILFLFLFQIHTMNSLNDLFAMGWSKETNKSGKTFYFRPNDRKVSSKRDLSPEEEVEIGHILFPPKQKKPKRITDNEEKRIESPEILDAVSEPNNNPDDCANLEVSGAERNSMQVLLFKIGLQTGHTSFAI